MRNTRSHDSNPVSLEQASAPTLSALVKRLAKDPIMQAVHKALHFDGQYTSLEILSDYQHALGTCDNRHLRALRELIELGDAKASAVTHVDLRWSRVSTLKDLSKCKNLIYLDTRSSAIKSLASLGDAAATVKSLYIDESCKNAAELKPFVKLEYLWECHGLLPTLEPLRGHQTLRELWVSARKDDPPIKAISGWEVLPSIPNLTKIIIDDCTGFPPEIIQDIKSLRDLWIQHQRIDCNALIEALEQLPNIAHLSFHWLYDSSGNSFEDALQRFANQRPAVTIWLEGKKISAKAEETGS